MKIQYCLICGALVTVLQSCIYIPTPQHFILSGRGMIENKDTQELQIGNTTREDILLQYGEPDLTIKRQTIFVYRWTRTSGYLIFGGGYSGEIAPVGKTTLLMFEFTPQNLLKRFEFIPEGIFDTTMEAVIKWANNENP